MADAGRIGRSVVVTGGGRGVGRAVVEQLLASYLRVVVVELDPDALGWVADHPARGSLRGIVGDAAEMATAEMAADTAEAMGPLRGWVNNAAVFPDADLASSAPDEILRLVEANLAPAVVGCSVAVRRFRGHGGGSIVNVSSHQATRPVAGALPYAVAKAAVEGLTRAVAVDHGPDGIRTNAVALGSIRTERLERRLATDGDGLRDDLRRLHPLGRVGRAGEVAAVVAFLLSDDAAFVNGAVIPVDGGRAALGLDPEGRPLPAGGSARPPRPGPGGR